MFRPTLEAPRGPRYTHPTMLDYRFIVEKPRRGKKNIADRNMKADADEVVRLWNRRVELTPPPGPPAEAERQRGVHEGQAGTSDRQRLIDEGKKLKDDVASAESELAETEKLLDVEGRKIPTWPTPTPRRQIGYREPEVSASRADHVRL